MAAERQQFENTYDDGGGYGKSRKRPSRRTHSTPYDRPPTAIRNPPALATNSGWVSRLVDPAQRLITSGAKKLFSSFISKRLTSASSSTPQPSGQPPETSCSDKHEPTNTGLSETRIAPFIDGGTASKGTDGCGITELELILKQKAFTRSEIEQLTALLQSRTADPSVVDDQIKSDDSLPRKVLTQNKEEGFTATPVENRTTERSIVSTPAVISKAVVEDVATPAELAKSYMGNRLSKQFPFDGSLHGSRKDLALATSYSIPSSSSARVAFPIPSTRAGIQEDGFATPRPLGRAAIYSMVRSPYSRVHSTTSFQGTLSRNVTFGWQSPLSQTSMSNGISSTKRAQKRRSSVIDNGIGPVSNIRRIRQKSNLLPGYGAVQGSGVSSSSVPYPPSAEKSLLVGKSSVDNGDNGQPGSVLGHVPSKSSETAARILRQLDALVTTREKSPSKLSPSMLNNQAKRSMENIGSLRFLENAQENGLVARHNTTLPGAHENILQKQEKVLENGPSKSGALFDKPAPGSSGVDKNGSTTNIASSVKSTNVPPFIAAAQPNPFKKHGFQMSAPEDFVEIGDDNHSKDKALLAFDGKKKPETSLANNITNSAEISGPAFSLINSSSSVFQHKQVGTAVASTAAEKISGVSGNAASLPSSTITPTVAEGPLSETSHIISLLNNSNADASINGLPEKVFPHKEPNGTLPVSSLGVKAEKVSALLFPPSPQVQASLSGSNADALSDLNPGNLKSSITEVPVFTSHPMKRPEIKHAQTKSLPLSGPSEIGSTALPTTNSTGSPSTSLFGNPANIASINNENTPQASKYSVPTQPSFSSNIACQNLSGSSDNAPANGSVSVMPAKIVGADTTGNSNLSLATSVPSFAPTFKFGSSSVLSSSASLSDSTVPDSAKATAKETSVGNLSSSPGITSIESSIFGGLSKNKSSENGASGNAPASASTVSGFFGGKSSMGNGVFSFSTSASIGLTQNSNLFGVSSRKAEGQTSQDNSTQSIPVKFGSSTSTPSFGLSGNAPFSSGISQLNSAASAMPLSSSTTSGLTFSSSCSEGTTVSFSSSSTSNVFSSSLQATPKSSLFGSTSSSASSSGFVFGATSTSGAASSSPSPASGFVFGAAPTSGAASSSSAPSSGFVFGAASTSSTPSSSSSPSSGFVFGAAPTNNTSGSNLPTTVFGSNTSAAAPAPTFSFSSPAGTTSQSLFANSSPGFAFGSSPGSNDQMSVEDGMAEDAVQPSMPAALVLNQPAVLPPSSGFVFGSSAPPVISPFGSPAPPAAANPFQFGGQPNPSTPSNAPSPFQVAGSVEFNAGGGNFSMGAGGGGDQSNRKFIKVKRPPRKR